MFYFYYFYYKLASVYLQPSCGLCVSSVWVVLFVWWVNSPSYSGITGLFRITIVWYIQFWSFDCFLELISRKIRSWMLYFWKIWFFKNNLVPKFVFSWKLTTKIRKCCLTKLVYFLKLSFNFFVFRWFRNFRIKPQEIFIFSKIVEKLFSANSKASTVSLFIQIFSSWSATCNTTANMGWASRIQYCNNL